MPVKAKQKTAVSTSHKDTNHKEHKIEDIISALDYLRKEAQKTGNEDIYKLIDSTFNICLHTYCMIKRYEMNMHLN